MLLYKFDNDWANICCHLTPVHVPENIELYLFRYVRRPFFSAHVSDMEENFWAGGFLVEINP